VSEQKETIAVDANPLLSALRGGRARTMLFSGKFTLITTEHTTWEVKKYIPELSSQSGIPESDLFYAFDRLPKPVSQALNVTMSALRQGLKTSQV